MDSRERGESGSGEGGGVKTLVLCLLSFASGYFTSRALETYISAPLDRLDEWKSHAYWAALGLADVIVLAIFWP